MKFKLGQDDDVRIDMPITLGHHRMVAVVKIKPIKLGKQEIELDISVMATDHSIEDYEVHLNGVW